MLCQSSMWKKKLILTELSLVQYKAKLGLRIEWKDRIASKEPVWVFWKSLFQILSFIWIQTPTGETKWKNNDLCYQGHKFRVLGRDWTHYSHNGQWDKFSNLCSIAGHFIFIWHNAESPVRIELRIACKLHAVLSCIFVFIIFPRLYSPFKSLYSSSHPNSSPPHFFSFSSGEISFLCSKTHMFSTSINPFHFVLQSGLMSHWQAKRNPDSSNTFLFRPSN